MTNENLPNFIIIGAHKAGTSSLFVYLDQHPEVYMSPIKEARYFCYDENDPRHVNKPRKTFPVRTMEEYRALFKNSESYTAIGEASPEYLNNPDSATRIHECIPMTKIIVGLRKPLDRAYSLYQMGYRANRIQTNFREWFLQTINGDDYSRGTLLYYDNLARYYEKFDTSQIKVFLFDDLIKDSQKVVADVYNFLNVDTKFIPDTSEKFNTGGIPKSKTLYRLFSSPAIKSISRKILPAKIQKRAKRLVSKNLSKAPPLTPELKSELAKYFDSDIKRVELLIGCDLKKWNT